MDQRALDALTTACRSLIEHRFATASAAGAAAMLLDDGTTLLGTAPLATNTAVQVCHETEPFCAAHRLGRQVTASICLHRTGDGRTLVLSPCGVCRERLATHGPQVLVAVADRDDATRVVWRSLRDVLPDYWMTVYPDDVAPGWIDAAAEARSSVPLVQEQDA